MKLVKMSNHVCPVTIGHYFSACHGPCLKLAAAMLPVQVTAITGFLVKSLKTNLKLARPLGHTTESFQGLPLHF